MAVITDEHVAPLYLEPLMESLKVKGITAVSLVLPAGEKTKSFEHLIPVCEAILGARIERNDAVIALGGGVIGDLTGFAAALSLRRGSRFMRRSRQRCWRRLIPPSAAKPRINVAGRQKPDRRVSSTGDLVHCRYRPRSKACSDRAKSSAGYAEIVKYGADRHDAPFFRLA